MEIYQTVSRTELVVIKKRSGFCLPYDEGLYGLIKCRFCGEANTHAFQMYPCSKCEKGLDDALVYSGHIKEIDFYLDRTTPGPPPNNPNLHELLTVLWFDLVGAAKALLKQLLRPGP